MGKQRFKKLEPSTVRGICVLCKKNPQKSIGNGKFRPLCSQCDKRLYMTENGKKVRNQKQLRRLRPYTIHKQLTCVICGFIAKNSCQMDVDHIDGNHHNNDLVNLQTLCACCHRLKTYEQQDWLNKTQNKTAPET